MKNILLPILLAITSLPAVAQLPVSQTTQNRNVVLEEFTGLRCGYCPDGHKTADDLKASYPAGSIILVNIHAGSLSAPGTGQPDFRTPDGNAIATLPGMNVTSVPAGALNRHLFSGENGFATSRTRWAGYAGQLLGMPSYVNVALEGTLNATTRVLTVQTEAFFTAAGKTNNKLTVLLLEDNVNGPQTDYGNYYPAMVNPDGSYNHNHMLRNVLTPSPTGEVLTPVAAGSTVTKTYTYTVPAQFGNRAPNLTNLYLAAYIAEGDSEIMTGAYGPLKVTNEPAGIATAPAKALSVTLAPNPASGTAILTLNLKKGSPVSVQVVDMTGRVVKQLAEQNLSAGTHKFPIATDNLAAGVYSVRIATAEGVKVQRLSVVK